MLPQAFTAAFFFQDGLKQNVCPLLYLINQESRHHQESKIDRKVFLTVTIIMFKMIALVWADEKGVR